MSGPTFADLSPGVVVEGPILPEPVEVLALVPMGTSMKVIGKGLRTGQVRDPILDAAQLAQLTVTPKDPPFDGDSLHFKLGVEAARLGLAYEYDPYFSLSIARVDPLPHQLEAVYDYFLKLPRIRFLLADDPGAGKTIMAGLLLKELKIRGLVNRTLIVAPANLTFQWQREMKDKFREQFDIMRGEVLRTQYGQNPWQEHNQVVTSVSWISRRKFSPGLRPRSPARTPSRPRGFASSGLKSLEPCVPRGAMFRRRQSCCASVATAYISGCASSV